MPRTRSPPIANWLGLMQGDLADTLREGRQDGDPRASNPTGPAPRPTASTFTLPGRSLLFVRNVGHLMTNPAMLLPDGTETPEGILDAMVTSLIALHDLQGCGTLPQQPRRLDLYRQAQDARAGRVRLHQRPVRCGRGHAGPARHTIKVGVMDEERRTSRQPRRLHPRGEGPHRVHQHRLPRSHRRRNPHLDAGRADDPQGRR